MTPLNLSSSDMRRLAKIAKANQSTLGPCAAKPPTGLTRQVSGASSTKSEPILQRQAWVNILLNARVGEDGMIGFFGRTSAK